MRESVGVAVARMIPATIDSARRMALLYDDDRRIAAYFVSASIACRSSHRRHRVVTTPEGTLHEWMTHPRVHDGAMHETRIRTIWLSDIHLGTRGCKAEALIDFLEAHTCEYLYLV